MSPPHIRHRHIIHDCSAALRALTGSVIDTAGQGDRGAGWTAPLTPHLTKLGSCDGRAACWWRQRRRSEARLTLERVEITECTAREDGGGVSAAQTRVAVRGGVRVHNNAAGGRGGGLFCQNGNVTCEAGTHGPNQKVA